MLLRTGAGVAVDSTVAAAFVVLPVLPELLELSEAGAEVGSGDGSSVGAAVGSEVGSLVGAAVGSEVGSLVGSADGSASPGVAGVGSAEGSVDGSAEGSAVTEGSLSPGVLSAKAYETAFEVPPPRIT